MGRTSRVVTSGLLICALAAVGVPIGLHLGPALLPKDPAAVAVMPAAQAAPTSISAISGVSPLVAAAPLPSTVKLAADLTAALRFEGEGTFGMYVTDAVTGQELFSQEGQSPRVPASNLKLFTAAAALRTLGAETRFSTQVVAGLTANELVVLAGGDAMLGGGHSDAEAVMGHAGLTTLAEQTAAARAAAGASGPVTISIDDTLFTGPALNPQWARDDVDAGEIAPIFPMALNAGRFAPHVLTGPRPQDSAVAVAEAFAVALESAGVATTGTLQRSKAPAAADGAAPGAPGTVLAAVESATVAAQTSYMLAESENYVAEVLARMVAAKSGQEASNTGAVAAVRHAVAGLGLSMDGVVTTDNCGLATGNLASPATLTHLMELLLADSGADIAQALPGLPVAGLSGTLAHRFVKEPQLDGAGLVRAKTGSLNQVTALTGYVINSQGRLLAFSILGNGFTGGAGAARPAVDAAAAVLALS